MAEIEPDSSSLSDGGNSENDSAYGESDGSSSTASVMSSIRRGIDENGRTYAAYGKEGSSISHPRYTTTSLMSSAEYGLPMDERELDRIDMKHTEYLMLLEEKLFLAPIDPNPQIIYDMGTGSGIWAIDVAEKYPSAEVIGTDLAPTQPRWVPPNCRFEIDDVEEPWTFRKNYFDFIHSRDFIFSIRDWPKLVGQCYQHVKPGGWVELACIHPQPLTDDNSTPADSGVVEFSNRVIEASAIVGVSLHEPTKFRQYMDEAGFVEIVERRFKIPVSPWPKDRRMKLIGAFETQSLLEGASAFSLRVFAKAFGWNQAETEISLVQLRKDVKNLKHHTYYEFIVVYGRKPNTTDAPDSDP
ncbi:MAG: hypothetical protein M1827_003111 [Pycnora praestabilis]|nr:MAG: hypothetical protein M1827_003111 [Pycnora praestabilis]